MPRPVGIASEAELLVLELAEPVAPATALDRLGPQMPPGVTLTGAADLEPGPPPQPLWVHYRLDIDEPRRASLAGRLAQLADHPQWLQRREGHKKPSAVGELDLKPLVEALTIEGRTLHMRLAPRDQVWARVDEVLELLGLDARLDRARLVRLAVHWDGAPDQPPAQSRSTE